MKFYPYVSCLNVIQILCKTSLSVKLHDLGYAYHPKEKVLLITQRKVLVKYTTLIDNCLSKPSG